MSKGRPATARPGDRKGKAAAAAAPTRRGPSRIVVAGIVAVLLVIGAVAGAIVMDQRRKADVGVGTAVPTGASMSTGYPAFASVKADPKAPLVEIYEDFQCPSCKALETSPAGLEIKQLASTGKIRVVYHILNFLDAVQQDSASTPLANGAWCAERQGRFQEFHDLAYQDQGQEGVDVPGAALRTWAGVVGVKDLDAFDQCVKDGTFTTYVEKTTEAAARRMGGGISTPTIYLNGTALTRAQMSSIQTTKNAFTGLVQAAS